jgi:hypothetical protein
MPSSYPGSVDTLSTSKVDSTAMATDHAGHHNDMADAINRIETELGTSPKGGFATVKARIAGVETTAATIPANFNLYMNAFYV